STPPAAAPAEFAFPADVAGRELPRVVAPPAPALPAAERFATAKVRTPPAKVIDPDPPIRVGRPLPRILPVRPAGLVPVTPAERVPPDLGFVAVAAVPSRPVL